MHLSRGQELIQCRLKVVSRRCACIDGEPLENKFKCQEEIILLLYGAGSFWEVDSHSTYQEMLYFMESEVSLPCSQEFESPEIQKCTFFSHECVLFGDANLDKTLLTSLESLNFP